MGLVARGSLEGKTVASANANHTITLFDVATGKSIAALKGHAGAVSSVAFSPDRKTLASTSRDGTIMFWDVASRKNTATLRRTGSSTDVSYSPDGKTLASSSTYGDKTIKLWDVGKK